MTATEHLEASNEHFLGRTKMQEVITDTTEGVMSESEVQARSKKRKKTILPLNERMPTMARDMKPKVSPTASETLPDVPVYASASIRRRG